MKLLTLATTIVIILLCSCNKSPQKQPAKYTDFESGWYLFYYKKQDSALIMLNRYVENPDDSLKKAVAYRFMGDIYWQNKDLYAAEENGARALYTLSRFDTGKLTHTGSTYNLLGDISLDLKQYDEAITRYSKAMSYFTGDDFLPEVMNGKATAFQKKGDYSSAIDVYDSILALKPADQLLVARAIDNRARTRWLQDPAYPVLPEFWQALKIRTDKQDSNALNASYAHLADYYMSVAKDSAFWYANKMHATATGIQSPDDIQEAIDKLIRLSKSTVAIQQWYEAYKKLSDSIQYARDTTRNRFAVIRYDVQKSKADNLQLQQHITRQRLLLYGLIGIAVIVITGLWLWYVKRRNRIKQESAIVIRESKLKTSQKVHDVVANGLYRIMNELEHGKEIEKEPLLDKIEALYEKSRDISYEDLTVATSADQNNQLHELLMGFDDEQTKVFIVGDMQSFRGRISAQQKDELQLVLTELMVNMKKHSRATNVIVEFKQEDNKAIIHYKDDGVGFGPGPEFGNGLKNTVSRIQALKGDVNFGKSGKAGASIIISFPV